MLVQGQYDQVIPEKRVVANRLQNGFPILNSELRGIMDQIAVQVKMEEFILPFGKGLVHGVGVPLTE